MRQSAAAEANFPKALQNAGKALSSPNEIPVSTMGQATGLSPCVKRKGLKLS
jgi:hypothetical protein